MHCKRFIVHVALGVLMPGIMLTTACAQEQQAQHPLGEHISTEEKTMTLGSRRRRLPPELDPVEVNGVRYQEVRQANKYGHKQKSGYLMASDAKTGELLWLLKVYEINYDEDKETDVQEVFFIDMALSDDKKHLIIENELDHVYRVNIETQTVEQK